jgi:hypothetical protein
MIRSSTNDPLTVPTASGLKLIDSKQDEPAGSVPMVELLALNSGQSDDPLSKVKLGAMLGLLPTLGIGKDVTTGVQSSTNLTLTVQ